MMNFYYDPILGLQYDCLGELFIIDLNCVPQNINLEEFIKECKKFASVGITPIQYSSVEIIGQITEYRL